MVEPRKAAVPHWSFQGIADCLADVKRPSGPFDPAETWNHHYDVWAMTHTMRRPHGVAWGTLRLKRRPAADGADLRVEMRVTAGGGKNGLTTSAEIRCADDALASPRAWSLTFTTTNHNGAPVPLASGKESAEIADGVLTRTRRKKTRVKLAGPTTCNWSLFDAVQRLPFDAGAPLPFDMLEEMDLLKRDQRLFYDGTVEVDLAGRPTRLHGFRQVGHGILPYHYWLDDEHRLLFAIGGLRAYLWRPA